MRWFSTGVTSLVIVACSARAALPQQNVTAQQPILGLQEGERVRVLAPPAPLREGRVIAVDSTSAVLRIEFDPGSREDPAARQDVRFGSVGSLWTLHRHTWGGAGWGAAGGAVLGGLFGAGISSAFDDDGPDTLESIAIFGLLGAGAGAVVGAIVGSALSGWVQIYAADADVGAGRPMAPGPAAGRTTDTGPDERRASDQLRGRSGWFTGKAGGWLSTWEGYSGTSGTVTQGGILAGAAILADFDWLRVGPEVMYAFLGDQTVLSYGGLFEVPVLRSGSETYLLLGAGGQQWNSDGPGFDTLDYGFFAVNGGAGLRFPMGSRTALGGELRAHYAPFDNGFDSPPWLFTLALTFGYGL